MAPQLGAQVCGPRGRITAQVRNERVERVKLLGQRLAVHHVPLGGEAEGVVHDGI